MGSAISVPHNSQSTGEHVGMTVIAQHDPVHDIVVAGHAAACIATHLTFHPIGNAILVPLSLLCALMGACRLI
jgi:hypothetical protein